MNESTSNGGAGNGDGYGGGDDEPRVVIVPQISRPAVSKGVRILATSFGELRRSLFEFADLVDEATRLGALTLSQGEANEIDEFLSDAQRRIRGVQRAIKRAAGKRTSEIPTTEEKLR